MTEGLRTVLNVTHSAPGGWLAVATDGRLAVVEDPAEADEIWAALEGEDGIQAVLDTFVRRGLRSAPPFALLEWDGDFQPAGIALRCIVRGDVGVRVSTRGSEREFAGREVTTWLEQTIPDATGFVLETGALEQEGRPLPMIAGAAWITRVEGGHPGGAEPAEDAGEIEGADVTAVEQQEAPAAEESGTPDTAEPQAPAGSVTPAEADEQAVVDQDTAIDEETVVDVLEAEPDVPEAPEPATVTDSTVVRSPEAEAGRIDMPAFVTGSLPGAPDAAGDHDGMTIMSGDLRNLLENRSAEPELAPAGSSEAPEYWIEFADGSREPLTQPLLVGRAPSVSQVNGDEMPRLVTVGGGDQDISRNHMKFTVEGDTVVATDLHSRNGTMITLPGKAPQRLRQGEPTSVLVGTVVDLGGGVTMTVRA